MGTSWIFLGAKKNMGNGYLITYLIELDDGKMYRKSLYLIVKTMVSGKDFPLNQPNDYRYGSYLQTLSLDG